MTEPEVHAAFDRLIDGCDLFSKNLREVEGTYLLTKPNQRRSSPRIDRVLVPSAKLINLGWHYGPLGVELKGDDAHLGKTVAQCIDYSSACFQLGHTNAVLDCVFIWQTETPKGDIASVMQQFRIGIVKPNHQLTGLSFKSDCRNVLTFGGGFPTQFKPFTNGYKRGNRG